MTPDYALLTTWADCDAALKDVNYELKTFSYRDNGLDLADDRATRSQEAGAAALARKDAEILRAQGEAGLAGLSAQEQLDADDKVELLQAQRKKIVRDNRASTGNARFQASLDAVQVQGQVDILTAARDGIIAHRATLTA
ncbi:hypothetical protein [Hymenobacter jeollabukensis]|uniref:Uncharacterized protein n=1 Tax=Hymenobacter jeollabukensis TaxID=2025313 RepID=A0A5R8WPG3_9BACT|nr:hypothetical protein [Hymenobacter jeollabukensis]TLM91632.1 hypothetical protein FDY95_13800 [Hymenobacter jeollabukensis]